MFANDTLLSALNRINNKQLNLKTMLIALITFCLLNLLCAVISYKKKNYKFALFSMFAVGFLLYAIVANILIKP